MDTTTRNKSRTKARKKGGRITTKKRTIAIARKVTTVVRKSRTRTTGTGGGRGVTTKGTGKGTMRIGDQRRKTTRTRTGRRREPACRGKERDGRVGVWP